MQEIPRANIDSFVFEIRPLWVLRIQVLLRHIPRQNTDSHKVKLKKKSWHLASTHALQNRKPNMKPQVKQEKPRVHWVIY